MILLVSPRYVHFVGVVILFTSALAFFISDIYLSADLCHNLSSKKLSWEEEWFTRPSESSADHSQRGTVHLVCAVLLAVATLPLMYSFRAYCLPEIFRHEACYEAMNAIINYIVVLGLNVFFYMYYLAPEDFFSGSSAYDYVTINGCPAKCFIGYGVFIWFDDILYVYTSVFAVMVFQSLIKLKSFLPPLE